MGLISFNHKKAPTVRPRRAHTPQEPKTPIPPQIEYRDRVVTETVQIPVEVRVEIPVEVEKIVYVDRIGPPPPAQLIPVHIEIVKEVQVPGPTEFVVEYLTPRWAYTLSAILTLETLLVAYLLWR